MTHPRRVFSAALAALALSLAAPAVLAQDEAADAAAAQRPRASSRYEVKTPHSSIRAGGARVTVSAPIDVVRKVATDYRNYSKFISRFDKARVVGRDGDKTDVYLQVPILKGAAKIWVVLRFEPPKVVDGEEVIEAHMVKGNVKRMDATWRLRKLDDETTQLALELLIVPSLPIPGSVVTGEVAYAADVSVVGTRGRSEKMYVDSKKKKRK